MYENFWALAPKFSSCFIRRFVFISLSDDSIVKIASAWNYTSRNKPVGKMPFAIRWSEKCHIVTSDMNVWKVPAHTHTHAYTYVQWYLAAVFIVISFDNDSIILHLFATWFHHFVNVKCMYINGCFVRPFIRLWVKRKIQFPYLCKMRNNNNSPGQPTKQNHTYTSTNKHSHIVIDSYIMSITAFGFTYPYNEARKKWMAA